MKGKEKEETDFPREFHCILNQKLILIAIQSDILLIFLLHGFPTQYFSIIDQ